MEEEIAQNGRTVSSRGPPLLGLGAQAAPWETNENNRWTLGGYDVFGKGNKSKLLARKPGNLQMDPRLYMVPKIQPQKKIFNENLNVDNKNHSFF